jgi:hypothetical protein
MIKEKNIKCPECSSNKTDKINIGLGQLADFCLDCGQVFDGKYRPCETCRWFTDDEFCICQEPCLKYSMYEPKSGIKAGTVLKDDDKVNKPSHYTSGDIECIDAIRSALTKEEFRGYCKGNVLKYAWREKHKGGDEDLKKIVKYIQFLIGEKDAMLQR